MPGCHLSINGSQAGRPFQSPKSTTATRPATSVTVTSLGVVEKCSQEGWTSRTVYVPGARAAKRYAPSAAGCRPCPSAAHFGMSSIRTPTSPNSPASWRPIAVRVEPDRAGDVAGGGSSRGVTVGDGVAVGATVWQSRWQCSLGCAATVWRSAVGVAVGVCDGVWVGVAVGVGVSVAVGVCVDVPVAVAVGVWVEPVGKS